MTKPMVVWFGLSATVLLTATGMAEARSDIRIMTCEQVKQIIQQSGAVVMTTGENTFRRFVANSIYCDPGETTALEWDKTKDTESCDLKICVQRSEPVASPDQVPR